MATNEFSLLIFSKNKRLKYIFLADNQFVGIFRFDFFHINQYILRSSKIREDLMQHFLLDF